MCIHKAKLNGESVKANLGEALRGKHLTCYMCKAKVHIHRYPNMDFDEMSEEDEDAYFSIFDQLEKLLDAPEIDLSTRESTLLDLQHRWKRAAN